MHMVLLLYFLSFGPALSVPSIAQAMNMKTSPKLPDGLPGGPHTVLCWTRLTPTQANVSIFSHLPVEGGQVGSLN